MATLEPANATKANKRRRLASGDSGRTENSVSVTITAAIMTSARQIVTNNNAA